MHSFGKMLLSFSLYRYGKYSSLTELLAVCWPFSSLPSIDWFMVPQGMVLSIYIISILILCCLIEHMSVKLVSPRLPRTVISFDAVPHKI